MKVLGDAGKQEVAASVQNALNAVSPVRIVSGVNGSRDQTTGLPPRTIAVSVSRRFSSRFSRKPKQVIH